MLTKSEIDLIKSLAHKRERVESQLFVAEGAKLVGEVLSSGWRVERIYATADGVPQIPHNPNMEVVSQREMERLSLLKTPSNVLALVRLPKNVLPEDLGANLTIALDGVQDPGNLGTIIRIADWFGIDNVVCSHDTADCYNSKVVQATMGAILRVRVHYTDLFPLLHSGLKRGVPVYGTFLEGENIYKSTLAESGIVVMGSEGRGVSLEVSQLIGEKLYIPPYPTARHWGSESLNVAVATSIICSEFRRRL